MDRDVINRKLESLRRCIARIESKRPIRPDVLRVNDDLQDIIALNLERAVQTCVDIAAHVISQTELPVPSTMGQVLRASQSCGSSPLRLRQACRKPWPSALFLSITTRTSIGTSWLTSSPATSQTLFSLPKPSTA